MKTKHLAIAAAAAVIGLILYKNLGRKNQNEQKPVVSGNAVVEKKCKRWIQPMCIKSPCPQTCAEYY